MCFLHVRLHSWSQQDFGEVYLVSCYQTTLQVITPSLTVSSLQKINRIFLFLFTGCYPTRAFWGHVHSSWCNLSPSEYPGKLHCVFPCILFPAHLLSTFTICVLSHSSGEDFKAVFRLQENKSEVNWTCSSCFMTMCKNTFDFYSSALVLSVTQGASWAADLLPWCLSERNASLHSHCTAEDPVTASYFMSLDPPRADPRTAVKGGK